MEKIENQTHQDSEIRRIDRGQAKREVQHFFDRRPGEQIYPDEVARALQLDLIEVIDICEELVKEKALA